MKQLLAACAIMTMLAFTVKDKLIGRWQTKPSQDGNIFGLVFKPDNSFDGYINKKPFVTGNYILHDSILSFTDNGCNGAQAIYKIDFFSNSDSFRFIPVSDTCTRRKEGITRLVLGRIK